MSNLHVRQQQGLLWLIFDRPPLNVLTPEMLRLLAAALRAALNRSPRLIVLAGTGERAFCGGGEEGLLAELHQEASGVASALDEVRRRSIPTVALVKGVAHSPGCELALLCETTIARDDAIFQLPPRDQQFFSSSLQSTLNGELGQEEAEHLLLKGATLTASDALHQGLVDQVVPRRRFVQDVEELMVMLALSH
jgi:enoyl-CoA hydratase/carnithine racemase